MKNKVRNMLLAVGVLGLTAVAKAVPPTTLEGVSDLGDGYITKATTIAISAAVLGFGWVGYKIVKKFVKGVTST